MTYATKTSVSPEKSQEDIKRILRKYGVTKFGVMEAESRAAVMFEIKGLAVRITLKLPEPNDPKFARTPARRQSRSQNQREAAWEQDVRSKWRALLLSVKAKLEAVESGIATIEQEFLPYMVMPNGQTVYEQMQPQLEACVAEGRMPQLQLLGPGGN